MILKLVGTLIAASLVLALMVLLSGSNFRWQAARANSTKLHYLTRTFSVRQVWVSERRKDVFSPYIHS